MPIISLSLNKKILDDIDYLEKKMGFSGRSEVVRTAIREYIAETQKEAIMDKDENMSGTIFVLVPEHNKDSIHDTQRKYDQITKTHIHQCLPNKNCMHILVVEGKGKKIKDFVKDLNKIPKVENVKFILAR